METICNEYPVPIKHLRLCPTRLTELVFITSTATLVHVDFIEHTKIREVDLRSWLTKGEFSCAEFKDADTLVLFSDTFGSEVDVDLNTGNTTTKPITGLSYTYYYKAHPELSDYALSIDVDREVVIVNGIGLLASGTKMLHSYSVAFDPLNTSNCARFGHSPTWIVFTILPEFCIMAQSERDDIDAWFGDWIPGMPGHLVTGSARDGTLHLWTVAGGTVTDTIRLEDAPVNGLLRMGDTTFIVAFKDGNLGVVDVQKRGYIHKINAAHTNTIFGATFLPGSANTLLTAGADGKICMWGMPTLEKKGTFPAVHDMSYHLMAMCCSPGGGYIATTDNHGTVFIISMKSYQIVHSAKLHKDKCMSVDWSPHNSDVIVTGGLDNSCVFYNIKARKVVATVALKEKARKVRFSRTENAIAVACFNGNLYVRMEGGAYHVIKTNKYPLFDVAWSPFHPNWIAATDDDGGVILYDIEKQDSVRSVGHDKARPVVWSEAVDYMLISGGYDGRMVFWDVRNMSQIGYLKAHVDHIYCLTTHPDRPTLLVSASRDETIRVWNCEKLMPKLKVEKLLKEDKLISEKWAPFEGSIDLGRLVHRIVGDGVRVTFHDGDLCHINDATRLAKKRIGVMTSALPRDQSTLMRGQKAKQAAIDAADLCLKSGDVKRYCELMFIAGEHDAALAAAPAVSYNFWQNLTIARAQMLEGSEQAADLLLVCGKPEEAITEMISLGKFDDAMLVAAAMREQTFTPKRKSVSTKHDDPPPHPPYQRDGFDNAADYGPYLVASQQSHEFAKTGKPLLSAASLLTVGDVIGAAWRLVHCGELMWAVEINKCAEYPDPKIYEIFHRWCVNQGCAEELLPTLNPRMKRLIAPLVPFESDEARLAFYRKAGMKSPNEYLVEAKRVKGFGRIQFLLLAGRVPEAVSEAILRLKTLLNGKSMDFNDALSVLEFVQYAAMPKDMKDNAYYDLVAISYYFAAYKAMWRGYGLIIEYLVKSFEKVVTEKNLAWLSPRVSELKLVCALTLAAGSGKAGKAYASSIGGAFETVKGIQALADDVSVNGGSTVKMRDIGVVPVEISEVKFTSICSGTTIKGGAFFLEDQKSAMSADEAQMWFEVTPFSPLETHTQLMPY